MHHALDHGFDVLVTLDADLSHQPEEIPRLLEALPDRDFVIGTRSGQGTSDYTGFRRFASVGGNSLARLLIPTGLTEYTTSMRAFTRPALEVLGTDGVKDEGYAFFMEVVYRLSAAGMRLGEVPITFLDRVHGASKIPKNQIVTSALVLARLTVDRASRRIRGRTA
jgi:dolichol-phosphate mannosyltransferase